MEHIIFHIDVNSAYLSWTSVHNLETGEGPDLREVPAIIGGDQKSRHGIVLAKSIPAKAFGIETAEPVASALRKCPNLVIAPPDHRMYSSYSHALMKLLSSYSPIMEQLSVDECFLDMTDTIKALLAEKSPGESPDASISEFSGNSSDRSDKSSVLSPSYEDLRRVCVPFAAKIKDHVRSRFGFTVNVGISTRKVLAKMASDFQKPDKVHTLFPDEIQSKMWPLPINDLYMSGRSSSDRLNKLGLTTIGDLAGADPDMLESHLKSHGLLLWEFANGIDNRPVEYQDREAKGIGNSTTVSNDITKREDAIPVLDDLAVSVAGRLAKHDFLAGTITVEIKYSDFTSFSHQKALLTPSNDPKTILEQSVSLFDALWNGEPIRLLGIRGTRLVKADAPVQMNLFDLDYSSYHKDEKHKKLDAALANIEQRYGKGSVMTARSLKNKAKQENKS